jgi:hypothetical protein
VRGAIALLRKIPHRNQYSLILTDEDLMINTNRLHANRTHFQLRNLLKHREDTEDKRLHTALRPCRPLRVAVKTAHPFGTGRTREWPSREGRSGFVLSTLLFQPRCFAPRWPVTHHCRLERDWGFRGVSQQAEIGVRP